MGLTALELWASSVPAPAVDGTLGGRPDTLTRRSGAEDVREPGHQASTPGGQRPQSPACRRCASVGCHGPAQPSGKGARSFRWRPQRSENFSENSVSGDAVAAQVFVQVRSSERQARLELGFYRFASAPALFLRRRRRAQLPLALECIELMSIQAYCPWQQNASCGRQEAVHKAQEEVHKAHAAATASVHGGEVGNPARRPTCALRQGMSMPSSDLPKSYAKPQPVRPSMPVWTRAGWMTP